MKTTKMRLMLAALCVAAACHPCGALTQDAFTLANRAKLGRVERDGDVSPSAIVRTDERYNRNSLFYGPRGWDYWNLLQHPQPYQNPNLWPDKRPTYFFGQLVMPAGSSLAIHGRFPYARYFKFNFYEFERNTFVAVPGASLAGYDIEPDPGSGNPFKVGADRQVKNRNFSINVLAEDPPTSPAERAKNTIYVGWDEKQLMAGFRIYVSDQGYDGQFISVNLMSQLSPCAFSGRLCQGVRDRFPGAQCGFQANGGQDDRTDFAMKKLGFSPAATASAPGHIPRGKVNQQRA